MNQFTLIFALMVLFSCNTSSKKKSPFTFIENNQGFELLENGQKVYLYQKAPVLSGGKYYKHYIHPLYSLSGEVVTRAYPEEEIEWHYNHRGIFWGWRQMFIQNVFVGDGWVMDNIDFEISLKALVPGVEIAGSDDDYKGYGGFAVRIASPETLLFRSENGPEEPQKAQLHIGPWVDFSTRGLSSPNKYGLSVLCHPSIPNFPSPWLLRSEKSMQNPAFPGWDKTMISMDHETILRYRIILHDGEAEISDISRWYSEYASKP